MVLESITTPEKAERRPWDMLFLGAMYAAIAVFLALWVFKEESSIVMILLTVIACLPLLYNTLKYEEEKDDAIAKESILLKEHGRALSFFMFLFVGFVLAYSLAYIVLPADLVDTLFQAQKSTIEKINGDLTGQNFQSFGAGAKLFFQILANNLKVLMFCLFFSFFYGAGAIFVLTWNASVISAAVGNFFRTRIGEYAASAGFSSIGSYFQVYSLSILRYFIHGIPEILGYFIGALAGGIISVAVIQHDFGSTAFKHVLKDSLDLIMLGVVILVFAAVTEVYVTPLLF